MKRQKHHDYPIEIIFDWNPSRIIIPLDWSLSKAETATEILNQIEEKIWNLYGDAIIEFEMQNRFLASTINDSDVIDSIDDDIPF